uniref:Exported protein n=1 Tax=Parastrongyloides trichosuri TaxID=131310 RepID=A0A0N4ZH54_PARTI
MILDGYSIIYFFTIIILIIIGFFLIAIRQSTRAGNGILTKQIDTRIGIGCSKKFKESIKKKICDVEYFRNIYNPKFTDCTVISDHANKPYVYRLIAFDEIYHSIDRQLYCINPELVRLDNESTLSFLSRLQKVATPVLDRELIENLSVMHEWCRHWTNPNFGEEELNQLRGLLKEFVKWLNDNQKHLSEIRLISGSLDSSQSQYNFLKKLTRRRKGKHDGKSTAGSIHHDLMEAFSDNSRINGSGNVMNRRDIYSNNKEEIVRLISA